MAPPLVVASLAYTDDHNKSLVEVEVAVALHTSLVDGDILDTHMVALLDTHKVVAQVVALLDTHMVVLPVVALVDHSHTLWLHHVEECL